MNSKEIKDTDSTEDDIVGEINESKDNDKPEHSNNGMTYEISNMKLAGAKLCS